MSTSPSFARAIRAICYDQAAEAAAGKAESMKAIELVGDIDDRHRLQAEVPADLPPGPVRLIVLLPEEDEAGMRWGAALAREWSAELKDSGQDIYTLDDGQPVNAPW